MGRFSLLAMHCLQDQAVPAHSWGTSKEKGSFFLPLGGMGLGVSSRPIRNCSEYISLTL